jgi:uncharacterized membrane protein
MRLKSSLLFFCLFAMFFAVPAMASSDYRISSFISNIQILQNTSLQVKETVTVNFTTPHHGIYRNIPIVYSSSDKKIQVKIGQISVVDDLNHSYKYSLSKDGDDLQIKIGDSDKTITGSHVYVISYVADNIIQHFSDHDELYWNVAGTGWDVPLERVEAVVSSPYASITRNTCFTGGYGQKFSDCRVIRSGEMWQVLAFSPIYSGSDLTFVFGLNQPNQLLFPSAATIFWRYTGIWLVVVSLPAILFLLLWYFKGRDYKFSDDNVYYQSPDVKQISTPVFGREHLPLVYSPIQGLTPAEVGTILDFKVDLADVVAEISELARLGYIKIFRVQVPVKFLPDKVDYLFVRSSLESNGSLKNHQEFLLKNLFNSSYTAPVSTLEKFLTKDQIKAGVQSSLVSKMSGKFYTDLSLFKDKLYDSLTSAGIFSRRPDTVKSIGMFAGGILSGLVTYYAYHQCFSSLVLIAGLGFGVAAAYLGSLLARRTAKGHALYRQIVGLKYFVGKGKWRYDIEEKHLFLEEILPLAISLGVINQLTSDMQSLNLPAPQYMNNFAVADFHSFGSSVGHSLAVTPSGSSHGWSGGSGFSGGFSGGGFGGGGGGGW